MGGERMGREGEGRGQGGKGKGRGIRTPLRIGLVTGLTRYIDREFEFYEFFSFLKFNEFYEFFAVEKNSQKIRNFANHRCLTCFDVLERKVHL